MTTFDCILFALLWCGIGNAIVCHDLGTYAHWAFSCVLHGRKTTITLHIIACIIWPAYFWLDKK